MKIGYRRRLTNSLLVMALLLGLLVLLAAQNSGWDSSLACMTGWALLLLIYSFLMRRKTYMELKDKQLIIYPLIPLIGRRRLEYEFQSSDDFELVKNRLYLHLDGKRKRILISPDHVEPADWTTFLKTLKLSQ